ncbi:MAG: DNA methyltransferase [Terriglobia bacterium]
MQLHTVNLDDLVIPERQRREFKPEELVKLANSISQTGLIQPIVIRRNEAGGMTLVAGERRIRAMVYVWNFGQRVKCGETWFGEGDLPCIYQGEMDPIDAFEMELEENIRRVDLTWQERATATTQLADLRRQQAIKKGEPTPSLADLAKEVRGESNNAIEATRKELIVSRYLQDPDVAGAKSIDDAFKVLKRKEERQKNIDYAAEIGATFTAKVHTAIQGSCLEIMPTLHPESFDVILTDPPYGIDADQYGDSGGRVPGAHRYDDSLENWAYLMRGFSVESFRLGKPAAHLYVFCDVDNFVTLKRIMADAGWKVFRTPLIWFNPSAMRTPWPEQGPQRKYQMVLYAIKGDKPVNQIFPDLVSYSSDENLGHEAQKPVALYDDLLRRSIHPGDEVLDPFCGSGPIFPAAHALKCKATGIELDQGAYGISVTRLEKL